MKEREINRNKMKKATAVLLVAALATAWGAGGVFAKYTVAGSDSPTARVAKWGVEIKSSGNTTFAKTYEANSGDAISGEVGVSSGANDFVIAPGTSGTLDGLTVSGTPEVQVKVSNAADVTLTGWKAGDNYYCPLKITVGDTTIYGLDYESAAAFETAIESAIGSKTAKYKAGTDLGALASAAPVIKWSWDYESKNGTKVNYSDANDTALGNLATAPTISIALTTTVTQID